MRKGISHPGPAMALAGGLAVAMAAVLAGCESIRITGGTSEVGNPVSAHSERPADDSSGGKVTGVGISATGAPIRILRDTLANP